MTNFLRRGTNFPSGIQAGGGDTSWDIIGQPTVLVKRISQAGGVRSATLPKGMTLLERWVIPDPEHPCTTGTVDIDDNDNSVSYGSALPASAIIKAALATPGQLNEVTRLTFTPTGLDGAVYVGFLVIMPNIRR